MSNSSPLELFMKEFLPDASAEIEELVDDVQEPPKLKRLGELQTPKAGKDRNELLKRRFLYRGGLLLLCGPTGVGKSALGMQGAINWSVGRDLFGVTPGEIYQEEGLRILIVQAENDEGDLAEMRDGVLKGCEDLSKEEIVLAQQRVLTCTICDKSAEAFAEVLDCLLENGTPDRHNAFDIVIVDPAFAYLGGDSNSQKDVSHFMRELLNPLLQKHQVGMILMHHTNKPLRGKEKDSWAAGDYAYLGAGSAEWINPARAALAIRSIGSDRIFEFRAAKRGKRLDWKDDDGHSTNVQYIAHHTEPGVICWRNATADEIEEVLAKEKGGRPKKCEMMDVLHCINANPNRNQAYYKDTASGVLKCSPTAVQNKIKIAIEEGFLRFRESGKEKLYHLTQKGQEKTDGTPSIHDWPDHKP